MNNVFKGVCGNFSQEGKKSNKKKPYSHHNKDGQLSGETAEGSLYAAASHLIFFLNYPN